MAPSAIIQEPAAELGLGTSTKEQASAKSRQPLKLSGTLDQYESFDVTPVIGREFPKARLVDWLNAPNSDELLRELAITSESHSLIAFPLVTCLLTFTLSRQSLGEASFSSGPRMI
jgi:hypothetical protein